MNFKSCSLQRQRLVVAVIALWQATRVKTGLLQAQDTKQTVSGAHERAEWMRDCHEWSETIKRDPSRSGTTWNPRRWGQAIFVTSGWKETSTARHSPFCTSLLLRVKVTYVLIHKAFGTELPYVTGKLRFDSRWGKKILSSPKPQCRDCGTRNLLSISRGGFFFQGSKPAGTWSSLIISSAKHKKIYHYTLAALPLWHSQE